MLELIVVFAAIGIFYLIVQVIQSIKNVRESFDNSLIKFECSEDDLCDAIDFGIADDAFELEKLTKTQFWYRLNRAREAMGEMK
jgi:hypothetical protein